MSNKNPSTRIVNVPAKYYPLLQREMDEEGIFAYVEIMNRILQEHYSKMGWLDGDKPKAAKEIVRG